jgi:AraC-like DNA-binding protein
MPAKSPRLTLTVDEEILKILEKIAAERGKSLSQTARELLEVGLTLYEDIGLSKLAEERLKTLSEENTLSHEEIWD